MKKSVCHFTFTHIKTQITLTVQGKDTKRFIAKKDVWKFCKTALLFPFLPSTFCRFGDSMFNVFLFSSGLPTKHHRSS